jgi:hypothetical protein
MRLAHKFICRGPYGPSLEGHYPQIGYSIPRLEGALAAAFSQSDRFTASLAQEVQLGASDDASAFDFDFVYLGRMQRELSFDTFSRDDAPNDEHLSGSTAASGDNRTAEDLDTFLVAFQNLGMNVDRIPDIELGRIGLQRGLFDQADNVLAHGLSIRWNGTKQAVSEGKS